MTPDEQRIAIARACGWTEISLRVMLGLPPNNFDDGTEHCSKHLPDYLNDLNACHEMEKVLTYEQAEIFEGELCDIAKSENDVLKNSLQSKSFIFHVTATQRAEAFLRTLGLWQETPTQPQ